MLRRRCCRPHGTSRWSSGPSTPSRGATSNGLVATCSEDMEFHLPTAQLARVGLPYRGHDGVRTYMRDAVRVWSELRLEPREFHEGDGVVVAVGRVYAWGEGRVVDTPAAWVWTLREGLVVRRRRSTSRPRRGVLAAAAGDRLTRAVPRTPAPIGGDGDESPRNLVALRVQGRGSAISCKADRAGPAESRRMRLRSRRKLRSTVTGPSAGPAVIVTE